MRTVGEIIELTRIEKGFSIEQVANELKIQKSDLIKIETDQITMDHNIVFYIGHLRSYTKYLNLDSKYIIDKFKRQISYSKNDNFENIAKPNFQNNFLRLEKLFSFGLIIVIFVSFFVLFLNKGNQKIDYALIPDLPENYIPIIEKEDLNKLDLTKNNKENQTIIENEEFSSSSAIASSKTNELKNNDTITLKILNPTWLQIRDESNKIILSRLMEKNEEFSYYVDLGYNVTAGNAGNILVMVNQNVMGKIGKYGEVVDSIIISKNFKN